MIHFHKYKIINSQIGIGTATYQLRGETKENIPMTTVLQKCKKCGKLQAKNIQGKWTLEDLTTTKDGDQTK
jgi:hypothetical protein